jgi:hypothetical protein
MCLPFVVTGAHLFVYTGFQKHKDTGLLRLPAGHTSTFVVDGKGRDVNPFTASRCPRHPGARANKESLNIQGGSD